MKKILLILPLLFWFGCEDEVDEDDNVFEGFSEAWVECKILSEGWVSELSETESQEYSYDSLTFEYVWNGLSSTYYDGSYREYNQWGMTTNYSNTSFIEYQDKWKRVKETSVNENGDTSAIWISTWDGLLQTTHNYQFDDTGNISLEHKEKTLYNEYGRVLERIIYSEELTDSIRQVYTYEDGWRLILEEEYGWNSTFITSSREYQWEDNKRIEISENETSMGVNEITYNYYWEIIKYEQFSYRKSDNNELKLVTRLSISAEYQCPGFEQIYP